MQWLPTLVFAMLAWLVAWGAWVTLRLMQYNASCMTRDEHAKICDKKDNELNHRLDRMETGLTEKFAVIQKSLDKQDEDAKKSRHDMSDNFNALNLKLSVMDALAAAPSPTLPTPRRKPK